MLEKVLAQAMQLIHLLAASYYKVIQDRVDGLLEEQLAKLKSAQTQCLIHLSTIVKIMIIVAFLTELVVSLKRHATHMQLQEPQIQIKQIYAIPTLTIPINNALTFQEPIALTQLLVLPIL